MTTLKTLEIAARCGIYAPLPVKTDILGHGDICTNSLRGRLISMDSECLEGMKYCDNSRLEVFDVHFVVLTTHADAPTSSSGPVDPVSGITYAGTDCFRREIEILNERFVDIDGNQVCKDGYCVQFRYKSHQFYDDIRTSGEAILEYGDQTDATKLASSTYYSSQFRNTVWAANNRRLVDPFAINFFIYDARRVDASTGLTVNDRTSHGSGNSKEDSDGDRIYRPYVLIDVSRLLHQRQSPEEHEMGHVFGLGHNCDPNVSSVSTDSNIMQTGRHNSCSNYSGSTSHSGGLRNEGFGAIWYEQHLVKKAIDAGDTYVLMSYEQVPRIIDRARRIQAGWCKLAGSN